ncbi:hypothetical protein JR316_0000822 [Psilocybe cubensis]|uniref:Uncharacterized protein n=2 Tax=Psilocybe cubensis TaxID=181762 RepID=A0ACB8HGG4_PSICU|nr:hypothetical protein JR316_0000822 [Psilocybe cubensis]KAH9486757.1 hypothetical protein JR316_0000822 [Psilocybe cubensis]
MSDSVPNPPFYILLAHSSLSNTPTAALSNTLGHPAIQYHFADDSPVSLLPSHPDEHVLILTYGGNSSKPTVQSISDRLAVVGLRREEAPGASAEDETGTRNNTMYIIETTGNDHPMAASHGDRKSAHEVLAQYKQRNAILRKALQYPANDPQDTIASTETPNLVPASSS